MKRTIIPGARTGRVRIPASKSQAHRLLICAALGEEKTEVVCDGISADIAATAKCLSALGAKIEEMETGFLVSPIKKVPEGRCDLYCGESGSTLRFLLPIAGALGAQAVFHREGRLPQRPLAPLDSVLKEHGMTLREDGDLLYCSGQLIGGNYTIAGNVSSQYISGLLMALPLLIRDSLLMVSGPLESAAYVAMTEDALQLSKLTIPKMGAMWAIPGQQRCHLPKRTVVEGDWSNTAFFLCMGALSKEGVTVEGLNLQSSQGDRGVLDVLRRFGAEVTEHGDAVTVRRGTLHGVMIDAAQGGRRAGDPLRPCERLYLRRAAHGHHPQYEHPLAGLRESCCHAAPRSRGLHRRGQIRRLSGPRGRRTLFRPLDRTVVHRGRHLPANSRARGHHACEPHRLHCGHY